MIVSGGDEAKFGLRFLDMGPGPPDNPAILMTGRP
jgi:hypothetical protein